MANIFSGHSVVLWSLSGYSPQFGQRLPLNDDWGSSPDVILAEELHAHHGEDEDDDAEDEGQVGERPHRVHHDRQDVVQRLPRLCQLEHPVIITKVFTMISMGNQHSVRKGCFLGWKSGRKIPQKMHAAKVQRTLPLPYHWFNHHHLNSLPLLSSLPSLSPLSWRGPE